MTKMSQEAYEKQLAELHEYLKSDTPAKNFRRVWEDGRDYQHWIMSKPYWEVAMELPPLVIAAAKYGKPKGDGKWIWPVVEPARMEEIFGSVHDRFVEQLREMMAGAIDHHHTHESKRYEEFERRFLAYERYKEFKAALDAAGVTQYKTSLTEHGMSDKEIKQLEKFIKDKKAEIAAARGPVRKESAFKAPGKGKYPKFDDTDYANYIDDLRSRYSTSLEQLAGYSGIPLGESQVENMREMLADFDYSEISATLGAQERQPPEDDYGSRGKFYQLLADLPEKLAKSIAENTLPEVDNAIQANRSLLESSEPSTRAVGFKAIRHLKETLAWLSSKFPGMDAPALTEARTKIAQVYDPRWALMAGGPLHEKRMKQIVFTTSPSMPVSEDDVPESINPAKDPVYGHVFMEQALGNLGTMYFVQLKDHYLQASKKVLSNAGSAWQVLQLFPDPEVGRDPDLIRAFGSALEAAADDGELAVEFKPDMTVHAAGTLKLKMSAADVKKLSKRTEELVAAAQANITAEAVLPDAFCKPQKWPYKDALLAQNKVKEAIAAAWEYNWKRKIDIKAVRVDPFPPGTEWIQEFDPLRRPIARLTSSYIGIVYEQDGKTHCVDSGIQLRQLYMLGKGYGEDLNVLFWGVKPYELPPAQVKRLAK